MKSRIENPDLRGCIMEPEEASRIIQKGMTVAFGGYTSSGYPKKIAEELVKRKKKEEDFHIFMVSGSTNAYLENMLGEADLISRRAPMIESRSLREKVNKGEVHYVEQQMNKMARLINQNAFGKVDVAIVEALRITKNGYIVPTSSVGLTPNILECAEKVIVEINMEQPMELEGLHDIFMPGRYPNRRVIPLCNTGEKIGAPYIHINPEKIYAIIESREPDAFPDSPSSTQEMRAAVDHLLNFLEIECEKNYGGKLPPVQTGFGNLATEIVKGLGRSKFQNLEFFCGGLQESNLALVADGRAKSVSGGSFQMTENVMRMLKEAPALFKERSVLRNIEITNAGEVIQRLGVFAINSAIETDIYGNVNSSHIAGNRVVNGIGGGANFAQNAELSILVLVSENKKGAISTIVPMVSHQDISEHDIDIVVTENGVADLRGKDDLERAHLIIENCASIRYRSLLKEYLQKAIQEKGGHHPQNPFEAFQWYKRLKEAGAMDGGGDEKQI